MRVENKQICLILNSSWQPISTATVKDAIISLNSRGPQDTPPALALDVEYALDADGEPNYDEIEFMNPVSWEEWITLPVRSYDFVIRSSKLTIRVPTILIAQNYNKMPLKQFRPTTETIRLRDKDTCQFSGRKLKRNEGNIEHIQPRSRGGKDTFENLVYVDKALNTLKGDKTMEEVGFSLIRKPRAPLPTPAAALIREARHPSWRHFLLK